MNSFHAIISETAKALLPLKKALSSLDLFKALMRDMGWTLEALPAPIQGLSTSLSQLEASLVSALSSEAPEDFAALAEALEQLITSIKDLKNEPFDPVLAAANFAEEFPPQLLDYMVVEHLRQEHPKIAFSLEVLGIIRVTYAEETAERIAFLRREVLWEKLPDLLSDPVSVIEETYGWGTEDFAALLVYQRVLDLALALGLPAYLQALEPEVAQKLENNVPVSGDPKRFAVVFPLFEAGDEAGEFSAGLMLFGLPQDGAELPGLALIPYAKGDFAQETQLAARLFFKVTSNLDLEGGLGIKVRPDTEFELIQGLDDPDTAATASGSVQFLVINRDSGKSITLIGSDDGSGLFYEALSLSGGLFLDLQDRYDLFLELALEGARAVVKAGQGDGFLQLIIPEDGVAANFNLAVGISKAQGFYFRGSGGLEINIPTHVSLGPLDFQAVTIGLNDRPAPRTLPATVGASVKLALGPLIAVVENMGLRADFTFPEGGGEFGPVDVAVKFKPPTGIGLAIDGQGFSGGGFLRFVEADQHYEGMLELEYQEKITLKAIGLLTTLMPDGRPGFSLLILITAEFTPIQLGLGFTLNGVGGLLGLNRTADAERLRSGLRDRTLDSVLFPQDVIANANRILSDLRQVFPPQADRFIFGPMARIGWGTPTVLTIDLGLLVEIPDPVRVLILGVVRALLPAEDAKLLQLQVNFLGVIEFEAQRLSIDASLYDSKLLTYTLSGDMAVRLSWGAEPNFLLTVGGFHPAYEPPPLNLPALRRLSLQLTAGDNPRLSLETYFAVTSNTVQFGAKAELYAEAGSFNVYGFLSFDVLFQLNPFYFIAAISAKLALRAGSSEIASISLDFTLEGPTPWHARGTAKLKICWFLTIKVRFDKTFGEERDTRLDDIPVLPLLKAALSDRGNWEAQLPRDRHLLVNFKQIETTGDRLVVYPFGILTIQQKVVPLKIAIQKFGSQRPADRDRFAIEQVVAGEASDAEVLATSDVREMFAPAQFFELSDAQKLASKSFERYDSGVKLVDSEAFDGDYAVRREVKYELFYIDEQRTLLPQGELRPPDFFAFEFWAVKGTIANSPLSFARTGKSALAPDEVKIEQEAYAVVNASDLRLAAEGTLAGSEAGAFRQMDELIRGDPALEGEILVVPAFEVNRS